MWIRAGAATLRRNGQVQQLAEEHNCMWLLCQELLRPTRTVIGLFLFYCDFKAVKYALYLARACGTEL